jgi:hypothetical protein
MGAFLSNILGFTWFMVFIQIPCKRYGPYITTPKLYCWFVVFSGGSFFLKHVHVNLHGSLTLHLISVRNHGHKRRGQHIFLDGILIRQFNRALMVYRINLFL